ncbi:hypothetical protein R3P38DRAFT_3267958 [Favolaschia claudopus]|uniref:Uncharacterized protein n=1 Tax=Favolaschia claudopus TaxID=2862362 RepID=A0AAW0BNN3_9AGAR
MDLPITVAFDSTTYLRDVIVIVDKDGRYIPTDELRTLLVRYIREAEKLKKTVSAIYDARRRGASGSKLPKRGILTDAYVRHGALLHFLEEVRASSQIAKDCTPGLEVEAQIGPKLRSENKSFAKKNIQPIMDHLTVRRLRKAQSKLEKEAQIVLPGLCRMGGYTLAELLQQAQRSQTMPADADAQPGGSNEAQDSDVLQSMPLENRSSPSATTVTADMSETDSSIPASGSVLLEEQLVDFITRTLEELRLSRTEMNTFSQDSPVQEASSPSISTAESTPVGCDEARITHRGSRSLPCTVTHMTLGSVSGGTGGNGGAGGLAGGAGGSGMAPQANMTNVGMAVHFHFQAPMSPTARFMQDLPAGDTC